MSEMFPIKLGSPAYRLHLNESFGSFSNSGKLTYGSDCGV